MSIYRQLIPYIYGAVLMLLLYPATLSAKQEITWLDMDIPPFYIVKGNYKNTGIADEITRLFIEKLPDYSHKRQVVTFPRAVRMFQDGETVCHVAFFKTPEREAFAYFSAVPSDIVPPIGITILSDAFSRFQPQMPLSLDRILDDTSLICGAVKERSYGPQIDTLLKEHAQGGNIFLHKSRGMHDSLFTMLMTKRIDYLISYPLEAMYNVKTSSRTEKIMTLPIHESSSYMLGYVACPKTDWGKQMAGILTQILIQERPTSKYRSFFEKWLDDYTLVEFRNQYDKTFLTTTDQ